MTSISLSIASSFHSRRTRPLAQPARRAPVEVAQQLVRVEAVGDVIDRDVVAEVRVATAVMARVGALPVGLVPPGGGGVQQRAAGEHPAGDQTTTS